VFVFRAHTHLDRGDPAGLPCNALRRTAVPADLPENPRPPNVLALHVDDVGAARAELEAKDIQFSGETFDTGVCHTAFFTDPDGNDLMLHCRYAPRP